MTDKASPIRPTDDEARALARGLIAAARFGALGVIEPGTGAPMVTRVAVGTGPDGAPLTLISGLSMHTRALKANPAASLLVGEAGERGDPLTHPRLTLMAQAGFVEHVDPAYPALAEHYLRTHRKAKLYIGFADFVFVRFAVERGYLNGGFGKAFVLEPADMGLGAGA